MDDDLRKALDDLVSALEYFWLRSQAAEYILEHYQIPNWHKLVTEYCARPESQSRAQKRFAAGRALTRLAQLDSAALEELAKALNPKDEPN